MRILQTAIFTLALISQQQPRAALEGVVVDAASPTSPLSKATVELHAASRNAGILSETQSDRDGRFYFPSVAPGDYRVVVRRSGYATAEYGQLRPGSPSIHVALAAGQRQTIQIPMTRGGVVSGRLIENGKPVGQASVVALKAVYSEGVFQTTPMLTDKTDDLGEYHLFWLPPGRYYILGIVWDSASGVGFIVNADGDDSDSFYSERRNLRAVLNRAIGAGAPEGQLHIPIYYPGTPDPSLARPIEITAGGEVRNVDFDVSTRPTWRVRGTITGMPIATAGAPPVRVNVRMLPAKGLLASSTGVSVNGIAPPWEALTTVAGPDGAFEVPRVVPGSYVLFATATNSIARVPVEVRDRNIDSLFVSFESGLKVTGRVASPGAIPAGLRVVLRQDPPMLDADTGAAVAADGTFTVANVPSGSYRVWVTPILTWTGLTTPSTQPGLYVTSIVQGQTDVLNDGLRVSTTTAEQPLTITVGSNPGTLQGRVADNQGGPAAATWVALIPEGPLRFRTAHRFASSDAAGRFQIGNVPPGNYRAYAWMDAEKDDWQDPGFVERYASLGTPVQLGEGATVTLELIAR